METTDLSEIVGKLIPNPFFVTMVKEISSGKFYSIIGAPNEIPTIPQIPKGFIEISNHLVTI